MKSFNGFLVLALSLVLLSGCATQYDLGNNNNANVNTNANTNANANTNVNNTNNTSNVNNNANDNTNTNPCGQCGQNEVCSVKNGQVPQCLCKANYWRPASVCELDCRKLSCGSGKVCNEGRCVEGCDNDTDCGSDFCNTATNKCQRCLTDANCPRGEVCNGGVCRMSGCKTDAQCPSGKVCKSSTGTCVECVTFSDCTGNMVCRSSDNTCVQCNLTADCPSGESCIGNVCKVSQECISSSDCPSGKSCRDGNCVNGCSSSNDCESSQPFCSAGKCVACVEDRNCPVGKVCSTNICKTGCRQDSECSSGQICDCANPGAQCTVATCVARCRVNSDCSAGQTCLNSRCVTKGSCTSDAQCARNSKFDPIGEVCISGKCQVKACTRASDCGTGRICHQGKCWLHEFNNGKPICTCLPGYRMENVGGGPNKIQVCTSAFFSSNDSTCWVNANADWNFPQQPNGLQECPENFQFDANGVVLNPERAYCQCKGAVLMRSPFYDTGGATARCNQHYIVGLKKLRPPQGL